MATASLEDLWESWCALIFPDGASPDQISKARLAFYAGAVSILSALTGAAATGETKTVTRALRQIQREITVAARESAERG